MKRELYFAKLAGKNHLRGFLWRAIDMIDSLSPLTWQKKCQAALAGVVENMLVSTSVMKSENL